MVLAINLMKCTTLNKLSTERLMDGLQIVRDAIGPVGSSGITDYDIKDTLYHYDFDVDNSVAWLIGM